MADEFEFESLPFQEAVDFFRAKGLKRGFDYRDVWQAEHQRAFTVAKAMTVDLLQDIRGVVDKAIEDGIAFEDFRDNLEPILRARGWWGRQEMTDPLTGETRDVQLGSVNRLRIIYDTNLRTSYSEGRWRQVQAVKTDRPFVEYVDPDPNPRPQHLNWSGTIVHVDDPWVAAHWPPLDYRCRCEMNMLSHDDIDREGLAVSMPTTEYTDYVNPRDEQTYQVPVGVHPSFAYPPGGGVEAAATQLEEKLDRADRDIAAAVRKIPAPSSAEGPDAEDAKIERTLSRRPEARRIMKSVSPEEWRAGWDYCADSDQINVPWRKGKVTPSAKALGRLFEKLPRFAGTTWRGMEYRVERAMVDFRPGSPVFPQGYWSASRSRYRARRFIGSEGVLFEIEGRSGRVISMLSPLPQQREVLFAPEIEFEVVSMKRQGRIVHVKLKEK